MDKNLEYFLNYPWQKAEEISLIKNIKDEGLKTIDEIKQLVYSNEDILNNTSLIFQDFINKKLKESKQMSLIKLEMKNGFSNWTVQQDAEQKRVFHILKENKEITQSFIHEDGYPITYNVTAVPNIVRESMYQIAKQVDFLEENDTVDIAVPETPVRKIKCDHDIYEGKEVDEIEVDSKSLKESVSKIDINKMFILSDNADFAKKNIEMIVESKNKINRVIIPTSSFKLFLIENANVKNYVDKEGFNYEYFMETRNLNVKQIYLKEFINNEISEYDQEVLVVDNVSFGNKNEAYITYDVDGISETYEADADELVSFAIKNDPNTKNYVMDLTTGESIFNEETYFSNEDSAKETTKKFIEFKRANDGE